MSDLILTPTEIPFIINKRKYSVRKLKNNKNLGMILNLGKNPDQ